ncbi:hypothetical protein AB0I10_34785 [Streptomyces sp. NPDC050636]|uniref:hypothetical protein n=1 Tax=Streptomyces sp. NPDC050636 TaxID=3154510 RepID=UPI00341E4E20
MRKSIAIAAVLLMAVAAPATASALPAAEPSQSGAANSSAANYWMDAVMGDMRGGVLNAKLDPMVMAPFSIKVKANSITNRDVKVNFTAGSMYGLSSLGRLGDCTYGSFGADMKMGCYVSLQPVRVAMNADVKGDSFSGNTHPISTNSQVQSTTFALVEFRGRRGQAPTLDNISIKLVTLATSVTSGKLDLNGSRMQDFIQETNQDLSIQLVAAISDRYAEVLRTISARRPLP